MSRKTFAALRSEVAELKVDRDRWKVNAARACSKRHASNLARRHRASIKALKKERDDALLAATSVGLEGDEERVSVAFSFARGALAPERMADQGARVSLITCCSELLHSILLKVGEAHTAEEPQP